MNFRQLFKSTLAICCILSIVALAALAQEKAKPQAADKPVATPAPETKAAAPILLTEEQVKDVNHLGQQAAWSGAVGNELLRSTMSNSTFSKIIAAIFTLAIVIGLVQCGFSQDGKHEGRDLYDARDSGIIVIAANGNISGKSEKSTTRRKRRLLKVGCGRRIALCRRGNGDAGNVVGAESFVIE